MTIIAHDLEKLALSLNELSVASMQHCLKISMAKTSSSLQACHSKTNNCRGSVIEEAQSYIYLGQKVTLVKTDVGNEINRRIQAG